MVAAAAGLSLLGLAPSFSVLLVPAGSRQPEVRDVHSNLGGMTPTTVHGSPLRTMVRRARPIGGEEPVPRAMAHHRHSRRAWCRVGCVEGAADERRHTEELESVPGHPGDVEPLRAGVASPEHGVAAGGDHVLERGCLLLVVEVLGSGEVGPAQIRSDASLSTTFTIRSERVYRTDRGPRCAPRCR